MDPNPEEAIHQEREIRIICVGAGASGLCLAYKLQRSFRRFKLLIYEKNEEISGTWHENTYPGCACDIPAHNYVYTFEPKPDWPNVYASSRQLKGYFQDFSRKYDLVKFIKLQHKVCEARWEDSEGAWKLRVQELVSGRSFEDICDIFIYACGYLNDWAWPKISGLDEYEGELVHSANWNPKIELRDKKVGLIGNGSSAVQILTQIQPEVARLTSFIRSPLWVFPAIEGDQRPYTPQEIDSFTTDPKCLLSLRKRNEATANSIFSVYLRNSVLQNQIKTRVALKMKEVSGNAFPEENLIPPYSVGCRRLTPGPNYLKTLMQDNVEVVFQGVAALTKEGCKLNNGQEHSLDVIICATGFDTSFRPRFPILGLDSKNLQDLWSNQPKSYLGIAAAGFPNLMMLLGPNSPVANGPLMCAIEAQADHILQFIDRYQTENIHSFSPKPVAVTDFATHTQNFMHRTVWTEPCRSGFKNNTIADRIPTLWPGSTLHCLEALKEMRADDWDIVYKGNRFAWLGNGISQVEFDPTSDLGYCISDTDGSAFASRRRRREVVSRSGTQPVRELHRRWEPEVVNL